MTEATESSEPLTLTEVLDQLKTVALTQPYQDRVGELLPLFGTLCPDRIERFFVSERTDPESGSEILSLWAFSRNFWLEARDFLASVDVDLTPYRVTYLGLASQNFTPFASEPGPDAVLEVEVETGRRTYSFLSATGGNCNELLEIVRERFVKNLEENLGVR
jgi:hypothetical protein